MLKVWNLKQRKWYSSLIPSFFIGLSFYFVITRTWLFNCLESLFKVDKMNVINKLLLTIRNYSFKTNLMICYSGSVFYKIVTSIVDVFKVKYLLKYCILQSSQHS